MKTRNSNRRLALESLDDRCLLTAVGFEFGHATATPAVRDVDAIIVSDAPATSDCGVEDDTLQTSYYCDDWDYFHGDSSSDTDVKQAIPVAVKGIGGGDATKDTSSDADGNGSDLPPQGEFPDPDEVVSTISALVQKLGEENSTDADTNARVFEMWDAEMISLDLPGA